MKKLRTILLLAVMCVLLTGCIKVNFTARIKSDKSMEMNILYALDASYFGEDFFDEETMSSFETGGWTVTAYQSDDGYVGVMLKGKVDNIDAITADHEFTVDISDLLGDGPNSKLFYREGEIYHAKWTLPLDDAEEYREYMDIKVTVNLPNKARSDNSTSSDKKALTWNLAKQDSAEFSFDFGRHVNWLLYAGIGCGIAALACAGVIISRKNRKDPEPIIAEEPAEDFEFDFGASSQDDTL